MKSFALFAFVPGHSAGKPVPVEKIRNESESGRIIVLWSAAPCALKAFNVQPEKLFKSPPDKVAVSAFAKGPAKT